MRYATVADKPVFPASAGVILKVAVSVDDPEGFPRIRGGDPEIVEAVEKLP